MSPSRSTFIISLRFICPVFLAASLLQTFGQAPSFDCGSNGSYGPINIAAGATVTLQVPPDGIFHCTTVTLGAGARLQFTPNIRNTPVYILATGDVQTLGVAYIDVSGKSPIGIAGGLPGPGGFAGGAGSSNASPAGPGNGPGGGGRGIPGTANGWGGNASFRIPHSVVFGQSGSPYGNSLLIPLVGGSGGGGAPGANGQSGVGGAGGGGAILIASNTRVSGCPPSVNSTLNITADAGFWALSGPNISGGGSGGAIRIVAPIITNKFKLSVAGISYNTSSGGHAYISNGRTRIDAWDISGATFSGDGVFATGSVMMVFPTPLPTLNVLKVATTVIAEGATAPVIVSLPSGSPPNQVVQVRAHHFGGIVPIRILLTPESGDPVKVDATIDNTVNNPATVDIPVTMPLDTGVNVQVFTR
jgi:hypothetical protein